MKRIGAAVAAAAIEADGAEVYDLGVEQISVAGVDSDLPSTKLSVIAKLE